MKKIYNIALTLITLFVLYSCTEKVLVLPEKEVENDIEILRTRPSLRPDSVKVYPAFYNSIEIVYPEEQPNRAVKSIITYTKDDGTPTEIEVTDFDQIVKIENLSIKEYTFKIVYLTEDGKMSNPVLRKATPYRETYAYVLENLNVVGDGGLITVDWKKPFDQEIKIKVEYENGGIPQTKEKISTENIDYMVLEGLSYGTDYTVKVTIIDEIGGHSSETLSYTVNTKVPIHYSVLSDIKWKLSPINKIGFVRLINNNLVMDVDIDVTYPTTDGEVKTINTNGLLNAEKVLFLRGMAETGNMVIKVKSATGEVSQSIKIEEQPEALTVIDFGQEYKSTWIATESSFRIAGTGVKYVGQKVLDGKPIPTTSVDNDDIWTNEWSKAPTNAPPHWIAIDFINPIVITEFKYYYGKDNARPKEVALQSSTNGQTYSTNEEFVDESVFKTYGSYTYTLNDPMYTRYFRMYIPSIYGTTTIRLSEFFFKGVVQPTTW